MPSGENKSLFDPAMRKPKQPGRGFDQPNMPLARDRDPWTSHAAGERCVRSDRLRGQMLLVLLALQKWPGRSSAELSRLAGLDRYSVARRLPNLAERDMAVRGPARLCSVTHRFCITWQPAASKKPLFDRGPQR